MLKIYLFERAHTYKQAEATGRRRSKFPAEQRAQCGDRHELKATAQPTEPPGGPGFILLISVPKQNTKLDYLSLVPMDKQRIIQYLLQRCFLRIEKLRIHTYKQHF